MTMVQKSECSAIAAKIRNLTQYLLGAVKEDLTQEQGVFQLPHSRTHIIWLIGHITMSLDYMVSITIGRKPSLGEAHTARFMFGSKPSSLASDYPSVGEMVGNLVRITEEVAAALEAQDDSVLDQEISKELPFHMLGPTVREFLDKTEFHTGYHAGQITMLRAAQGLPAGFGM